MQTRSNGTNGVSPKYTNGTTNGNAKHTNGTSKINGVAKEEEEDEFPSILELKRSLPAHCFQPSLPKSLYYIVKDLVIMSVMYIALLKSGSLYPLLLPVYWYLQGTMMWALFVLGHDCGHGSFSPYTFLNDLLGNFLHALILVPYYPWKVSHQHHHKNTANIDRDEIFYPVREKDCGSGARVEKRGFLPLFGFGISWFIYLARGYSPRAANHLNPLDPLFARHAIKCSVSLAFCGVWIALVLFPFASAYGFVSLLNHYLIPVFVFASWLVVTTFLHHQDEGVPWYADHKWGFVKGQLSSVDRHYGWAHTVVHNIGTHQVHHLFSKIPHYHLEEATTAFRSKYPDLVRVSEEPIIPAFAKMFRIFNKQQWIDDDKEVHVYSDDN